MLWSRLEAMYGSKKFGHIGKQLGKAGDYIDRDSFSLMPVQSTYWAKLFSNLTRKRSPSDNARKRGGDPNPRSPAAIGTQWNFALTPSPFTETMADIEGVLAVMCTKILFWRHSACWWRSHTRFATLTSNLSAAPFSDEGARPDCI